MPPAQITEAEKLAREWRPKRRRWPSKLSGEWRPCEASSRPPSSLLLLCCAAAAREWRPLAEQGDALAQHNIGFMYENGFGLAQE